MGVRETRDVETADGRRLRVEVAGDCVRVVVVQLGSPEATPVYDRWVEEASARGLTLVAYDRPGYGGSSPQPGRSVADCAADVRAISTAVGFDRCAVWGFSGGGPHALACGALLGDLVAAVAITASWAPLDAAGLDYFGGMPDAARAHYELFLSDRDQWERTGQKVREDVLAETLEEFVEQWSQSSPAVDADAAHGAFGSWLHRSIQGSLKAGPEGWDHDLVAFHCSWGFDPRSISVPVRVWHGSKDAIVPIAHGRWLAAAIPGAQATLSDEDGHLTVAAHRIGEVHDWLAQHL
ncbi:MAG: alpha/beta fold hydrolase [Solirubrobacteraceae bacterium]